MALNYADHRLAKIECDKICSDNCDVQNLLINPLNNDTNKGSLQLRPPNEESSFMVETFINPPVNVRIEMKHHPIDIFGIELGLQVRNHKSSSIIISVWRDRYSQKTEVIKLFNISEKILFVMNPRYMPGHCLSSNGFGMELIKRPIEELPAGHIRKCMFPSKFIRSLYNIHSIEIRIVATLSRTIPCLSRLRIYGKPSKMNVDAIYKFCREYFPNKIQPSSSKLSPEVRNPMLGDTKPTLNREELEKIAPPEFLDSLTDELMTNPYELPSGKNIDEKSLNKFLESFGDKAKAYDPFTRVTFTDELGPKPNKELRKRIIKFKETNGQSEKEREADRKRKLFAGTS